MSKEYTRIITTLGTIPVAGSILFHDDFESLLRFTKTGTGGDDIFELDPTISFSGAQSLHLKTRTTATAEDDEVLTYIKTHLHPSKLVSQIIRLYSPDFTKIKIIDFDIYFYDGVNLNRATVVFTPATPAWTYLDSAGDFPPITGAGFNILNAGWHTITLKASFATNKYISLTIDHHHFDLSTLDIRQTSAPTVLTHLLSQLFFTTVGASPAELYLDEYSLTET